uniref:Uncharacterized protein n=1 Tax=Anguilla anguilla TaxID=7936 RepID=A0A0E9SFT4_ANGAN
MFYRHTVRHFCPDRCDAFVVMFLTGPHLVLFMGCCQILHKYNFVLLHTKSAIRKKKNLCHYW